MIKENQKLLNWMQVLLDAAVIVVSYIFEWYIRFRSGLFALDEWYLSRQSYMKLLYVIVPVFLILYYAFRLYVPKRIMGRAAGECDRIDGIDPDLICAQNGRYFPYDVVCVRMQQCIF